MQTELADRNQSIILYLFVIEVRRVSERLVVVRVAIGRVGPEYHLGICPTSGSEYGGEGGFLGEDA